METPKKKKKQGFGHVFVKDFKANYLLYLLVLPVLAYYIIFAYGPMGGVIIALRTLSRILESGEAPGPRITDFSIFCPSSIRFTSAVQ